MNIKKVVTPNKYHLIDLVDIDGKVYVRRISDGHIFHFVSKSTFRPEGEKTAERGISNE